MEDQQAPILRDDEQPSTPEVARKVIDQIRAERGHMDKTDEVELSKTSPEWQEQYRRRAEKLRKVYASYTSL